MSEKPSIFESFPIQLKDGDLRTFALQFKPESNLRIPTRLDFIRASRKLTLDETFGSDILVYPDFNTNQGGQVFQSPHFKIIVIFPDDQDFDCIGFDELADKIGLVLNDNIHPPEVDPRVLTQALSFVCETKLSPKWNRINQYLVRFPDFLDRKDIQIVIPELRAKQMVNDEYKVHLSVKTDFYRWPTLTSLDDFDIDVKYRKMFENGEIPIIPQQHLGNQWLHVLPKMTKGKLRSLSRQIISSQHIQNHEDMRLYWKMLYGYELPTNFGSVYCNITFGNDSGMGLELFCYPIECVRVCEPFSVNHRPNQVMERDLKNAFLKDVQEAMPSFCKHYKLEFSVPKVFIPKLFNAAKDGDQTSLKEDIDETGDHDTGYGTSLSATQTPNFSSVLPKEATQKYVPNFSVKTKIKTVASQNATQNSTMTNSAKRKLEDVQTMFSQEIPSAKKANFLQPQNPSLSGEPMIIAKKKVTKKDFDLTQVPIWAAQGVLAKKSNALMLRQWLFESGVPSKAKTKKEELVAQVMEKLGCASEH